MAKTAQTERHTIDELLAGKGTDGISFREVIDALGASVPFAEAFIVSSVPRGGLQIVQPARVPEVLVNAYAQDFHTEDRCTFLTIAHKKPYRGTEAWGKEYDKSSYLRDFLLYNCNLYHMVSIPLTGPVFVGYPGALHLYRLHAEGAFKDAEIDILMKAAAKIDAACDQQRASRRPAHGAFEAPWAHRLSSRFVVLDSAMKPVYGGDAFAKMDDRLRDQLLQHAEQRLGNLAPRGEIPADRLQVPDSRGDLWTFRAMTFRKFPALSHGTVIFFCMQPESLDWATIRPGDFLADQEMVRLVPAIQFMRENFQDGPTLTGIARSVYLSPFHFHRRFTSLFGLTPKHFLLECQIYEAKRQLMTHQKELSQIAADCGFAHQSHFTSRFKQATGLTPTRWRKLAQDMQRDSTY